MMLVAHLAMLAVVMWLRCSLVKENVNNNCSKPCERALCSNTGGSCDLSMSIVAWRVGYEIILIQDVLP